MVIECKLSTICVENLWICVDNREYLQKIHKLQGIFCWEVYLGMVQCWKYIEELIDFE